MITWINVWKMCLHFSGRTSRREFWTFAMWNAIVWSSILFWIELIVVGGDNWDFEIEHVVISALVYSVFYCLLTFLPVMSITARRLHDIGKSGWNILLFFTPPPIGLMILVYWLIKPGQIND